MEQIIVDDIKVDMLEKSYKYYLNKSTILFGASNSGKSTILLEILYLLKDKVPNIFVFSPTADNNNTFFGIVPEPLIFKELDISKLNEIYKRQQASTKIYNTVNDIVILKKLFDKVSTIEEKRIYDKANITAENFIEKHQSLNKSENKIIITEIKNTRDKYLIDLYKSTIRKNKTRLKNMGISTIEQYTIRYLDFNPNCVVVLDDCGAILKKFQKEEVVKKILFQGRHSYINLILTLQDDMNLDSSIKKNSFVNIFTTSQCANAYFERSSNNFNKKEKEIASKIIPYIFSRKDYKKLVYIRDDINPFRYTIADIYDTFRFGSKVLWDLCDKIDKQNKKLDLEDPMLSDFKINI
jgi:hypothetical protein